MFDLTRLRLLREFARLGTMSAVAEACGMTSSAVSQHLAILEGEARTPLLERIGRRVRLTAEGEKLALHAETIMQAVEAAAQDLHTDRETPSGVLDVAVFATYAKARLLPAMARLRERYPALKIVVHELEPRDLLEAVRDGACDLAISFDYSLAPREPSLGLTSHLLMKEPIRVALPGRLKDLPDPIDLAQLADEDWIVGSRQADDRELAVRACATAGFTPRITHAVADYDLVLEMVAAGLGVSFAPALAFDCPAAARVAIRTPGGVALNRRIDLVTRPALAASPRVRVLVAELSDRSDH